jgi:hypothetical protein
MPNRIQTLLKQGQGILKIFNFFRSGHVSRKPFFAEQQGVSIWNCLFEPAKIQ